MNESLKISVIIPTYNRKELLQRAIHSVLRQTNEPHEIIVVDDGSLDGTDQLINSEFPQIKYLWQQNAGISSARNLGIRNSSGTWIAFLDSDDEWLPIKTELQIAAINKNPESKICHTNEIWIRNGKRVNPKNIHQKYGGQIFEKCLPLCVISPSSVLIKKEVFNKYGLFDSNLPACEDYDLWLRICAFLPVLYINEPLLIKYGGHKDQLSKKYWGMDRFRIIALEKAVQNKLININYRKSALQMLIKKLEIFINGSLKRDKQGSELNEYNGKLEYYKNIQFEN